MKYDRFKGSNVGKRLLCSQTIKDHRDMTVWTRITDSSAIEYVGCQ